MTDYALRKYLPPVSGGGSFLIDDPHGPPTQIIYYAVDAEFAVSCEITADLRVEEGCERVVRLIGFFPHNVEFDDFGTLQVASFDVVNCTPPEKTDGPIGKFGQQN